MYSIFNDGHGNLSFARSDTYTYDANGNMTCRAEGSQVFVQAYNAENRLATVTLVSGSCASPGSTTQSWTFAYDGDGNRVSQAYFDGTSTLTTLYFFGGLYETTVETSAVKKYYAIAGQVVAMNDGAGMKYLLTDHLGSVVAVTNASGSVLSQTRYLPFGQVRTDQHAPGTITQTDFAYTGQRNVASLKLMDYHARFYDGYLNRWTQPDTVIPSMANPQSWNRYGYVQNDPIALLDPTGHFGNCKDEQSGYSCRQTHNRVANLERQWHHEWVMEEFNDHLWDLATVRQGSSLACLTCGAGGVFAWTAGGGGSYGHDYMLSTVICPSALRCTAAQIQMYARMFDYPGQPPWIPVRSRFTYYVFPADFLVWMSGDAMFRPLGAIKVYISPDGLTLTNRTESTHMFYDGQVVRQFSQDAGGGWRVTTQGNGTNRNAYFGAQIDEANQAVGPTAFEAVDAAMRGYIEMDKSLSFLAQR